MSQIAVRTIEGGNDTLNWILTDHLSSASVIANADGTILNEVKYTAFGEIRLGSGDMPTKYQYTGQLSQMAEIGLHYFVARWMDPVTGHFVQADTIVPNVINPLDWDRYSYGRNNPFLYVDPSGHNPIMLIVIGVALITAALSIDQIDNGSKDTAWASSQPEYKVEQSAVKTWQDNCMGRCHYSQAIEPAPGTNLGGPRPKTPVSDVYDRGHADIATGTLSLVGSTATIYQATISSISVRTPYGRAWQKFNPEALKLHNDVKKGKDLYRVGELGKSQIAEAQFWAPEHPVSSDFASRYGVAYNKSDYIIGGTIKPRTHYITRYAPQVGTNPGGALEVVTSSGGVGVHFFCMQ
jgi:RHS repeat-associated protein